MSSAQRSSLLLAFAIIAVALNLRPVLASISPLLDMIQAATHMTNTTASLLTTLPIFVMGVFAYLGKFLRPLMGEKQGIALGLFLIALACLARFQFVNTAGLLLTAVIAGVGIAIIQALAPSIIKRLFSSHANRVMGLYTTGIMGGAAFTAASVVKLESSTNLSSALAIWAIPAFITLLAWLMASDKTEKTEKKPTTETHQHSPQTNQPSFWKQRRAWELMIFFGISTGAYTLVLAWLPPFYTALGMEAGKAGLLLSGISMVEVIAGLTVSAFTHRFQDQRILLIGVLVCLLLGLLCLIFAPLQLLYPALILLGIGLGSIFPLSLILTLSHSKEPARAGDLAAFVQGGGYIIASLLPLFAGIVRDIFADLTYAWGLMLAGTLLLIVMSWRFSETSYREGL